MKLLINYSNWFYKLNQLKNHRTGLGVGGFDKALSFGPRNIEQPFYKTNQHILSQKRGNGYWLWKPYLIKRCLEQMQDGDFLFYSDADAFFIDWIDPIIDLCLTQKQDVIPFETQYIEKYWTKRDAFLLMGCDTPEYTDTNQRLSGFTLWQKSPFSLQLADEFLAYAQDQRIITDSENQLGLPNYPGFKENRHDQTIWSLLTKKHGLKAYRDPTQYGNSAIADRTDSPYGQILELTQNSDRDQIAVVFYRKVIGKCLLIYRNFNARFRNHS